MTKEEILNGKILLIDKPLDWTSFQVVNKLKYKIRNDFDLKKIKIGHAGTLDPRATGLLLVCVGKATKSVPDLQDAQKEYLAEVKLGVQTLSYDTEHPEILPQDISHLSPQDILCVLEKFKDEITQIPPVFSALKVGGKRAYDLARKGNNVEIKPRQIMIHYLDQVEIDLPFVRFRVGCSKGTYIRSLAHDIGQALGVGGYLTALRRTRIGKYKVENALENVLDNEYSFRDEG